MFRRPIFWFIVSLCCFGGALWFWNAGNRWAAEKRQAPAAEPQAATNASRPAPPQPSPYPEPFALLTRAENLTPAGALNAPDNATPLGTNTARAFKHRLSNTTVPLATLMRSDRAILLENALIDTASGAPLPIPAALRSQGDPGAYIVQANRAPDKRFTDQLAALGATVISPIPNNAYLVRGSASVAQALGTARGVQSVTAFEPYFKLKPVLLRAVLEPSAPESALPENARFNVVLFSDAREQTLEQMEALGARILGEEKSPFGPLVRILPPENMIAEFANLPGVQIMDLVRPRILANDLSRERMQVAADSTVETNYMDLRGSNVIVGLADRAVADHPDYTNRIFWDPLFPFLTNDVTGHGTHVAGTIIGSGAMSSTVSNAQGSVFQPPSTNHFRGKAPEARIFATYIDASDTYLQERAARSNIFIWNNSWNYEVNDYDIAAASYDAAVRDALPMVTGSTPLLYVFPGGNAGRINNYTGSGFDAGQGGVPDTILSPATAKNVITVGAVEQLRSITNEVIVCTPADSTNCVTNTPWMPLSDANDEIAGYSSRGNVGIGIEGDKGRFKPDVVAPGSFVISTRAPMWDTNTYYTPVEIRRREFLNQLIPANNLFYQSVFVPDNAVSLRVEIFPNRNSPTPMPNLPIYVRRGTWPTNTPGGYDFVVQGNVMISPPDGGPFTQVGQGWYLAIESPSGQPVSFDLVTELGIVADNGSRTNALITLNNEVGPHYRYESGSSMAAGAVAGTVALIQDFFTNRLSTNISPALMKALVINGARSVGNRYNFEVASSINYQGWGMVNLPGSLHGGALTNDAAEGTSMAIFDQSPETALATGDTATFNVDLTEDAIEFPLRITLVWSDPPGNPLASIKLVNDLDLIVTNNQTGEVFFGNDIRNGNDFNAPWDTNTAPTSDVVNNVENIYLNSGSAASVGTNLTVTVVGRRINVNAVTAHTNNHVQDFALVISSGNGEITNGMKVTRSVLPRTGSPPLVTYFTNMFGNTESDFGGILQKQHVGANSPLLGTNQIGQVGGGVFTIGQTSQWHFYILTNSPVSRTYTNAAFLTFLPPNLSVPRMGTRETDPENASRPEADIDLYVSTNPELTNLNPTVLSTAWRSISQGGTETVVITNGGGVDAYYVGVKSEDQQSAEYSILGVVSQNPFSEEDANGNQILRGFPVPNFILDGSSQFPGVTYTFAIGVYPIPVRRVIVTNILTHELMGDLVTTLSHGANTATLNNHTTNLAVLDAWFTYDDSDERNVFNPITSTPAQRSDGPGTLMDFGGEEGTGQWLLTYVDNAPGHVGTNQSFTVFLERQPDLEDGVVFDLESGACRVDYIDVPPEATNLTILMNRQSGTGPISVEVCPLNAAFGGCASGTFTNADGSVTIDRFSQPTLVPTTYSVRTCNLGPDRAKIRIQAIIGIDPNPPNVAAPSTGGPVLIQDDAVSYSGIFITNHSRIADMDVGLLIRHPRISDLAITLISPNGDRVLLFEDRGNTTAEGLGTFFTVGGQPVVSETNLTAIFTNDFESIPTGPYAQSSMIQGWLVLSNMVGIVPDLSIPWRSNNVLVLADGAISNNIPTLFPGTFRLSYETIHAPYIVGTVSWWPLDGNAHDIFSGLDGLPLGNASFQPGKVGEAFYGDGSATRIVVPRAPELNVGLAQGITMEGWIFPIDANNIRMPIAQWSEGTNGAAPGLQFWATDLSKTNHTPGAVSVALWGTLGETNHITTPTGAITNLGWQHVAFTYRPTPAIGTNAAPDGGQARIFVNGQLLAVETFTTNFIPDTRADLWLGFDPTSFPGGRAFQGGLDELALYERALSEAEIQAIYLAGSNGKHGTNALTTPVATELTLGTSSGTQVLVFTNGVSWTNGTRWETNWVEFTHDSLQPSSVVLRALDPNAAIDNIQLSITITNAQDRMVHFTDNTNIAPLLLKFAPTPFQQTYAAPALRFTNFFDRAVPGTYEGTNIIIGSFNPDGVKDWTVFTNAPINTNVAASVTVISNTLFNAPWTNSVLLGNGGVETLLPTTPGGRYRLQYAVRGPGMVGWWNGDMNPLNRRAYDLIGGNDGAMLYGATNIAITNAFVTNRFAGRTTNVFYFNGTETNGYASKIELGDPENLWLTNSFTIEAWILPMPHTNPPPGTEQIFFRGDSRQCLDPYYLALERVTDASSDLRFHVEGPGESCGVDVRTTGGLIQRGLTNWQHVAAVFEVFAPGSNMMSLYYNGLLVASNITSQMPLRELDPAYSPGIAIGNRSRADNSQPFRGYIDELGVYARALTASELRNLGTNAAGRADMTMSPASGLARVELSLDGEVGEEASGLNDEWVVHTFEFTARQTNVALTLLGLTPGTAVAGFSLLEVRPELSYQPEQPLSLFNGLDPYGLWRLEIWDTRANNGAGGVVPLLVQWQLDFKIIPDNRPAPTQMFHGITQLGRVQPRASTDYVIQVPQWARRATNVLLYARDDFGAATPIGVIYNTNYIAFGPTNTLFWPPVDNGTNILSTLPSSQPPLWVGYPYYLTVTNPNNTPVNFELGVWFDIMTLTNCTSATNFVGPAGIPRYFQIEVPTNGTPADLLPQVVSVWLTGANTNLTVVMSENLPLPDLAHYDYISASPSTNDEIVMLVTNSTPFPIMSNRWWYVGVFNSRETNVPFDIEYCVSLDTNLPIFIPIELNNPQPWFEFELGPSRQTFFEFNITNPVSALLFELYDMDGDGDLVLQRDVPPVMAPYLRGSFAEGNADEQIVLRPSFDMPDLRGRYYLGVINNEAGPLSYTIRVATTNGAGLLISGQPIVAQISPTPTLGPLITWNAVEGERYYVQFATSVRNPNWTNLATITATTRLASYQVPVRRTGLGFYRIAQTPSTAGPVTPPIVDVRLFGTDQLRIAWPSDYGNFRLQYTENFVTWFDWPASKPILLIGNEFVTFDDIGAVPRFYRLH